MTKTTPPPSPAAMSLVAAWPADGWLDELAATRLAADTCDDLGLRTVRSVLNEARRRSWLIRDNRSPVMRWKRTPKGEAETVTARV